MSFYENVNFDLEIKPHLPFAKENQPCGGETKQNDQKADSPFIEFKEIRKEWKQRKKEEEAQRKAEEERQRAAAASVAQNGGGDPQGPDGAPSSGYPGRAVQLPPIGYQPTQYPAPPSGNVGQQPMPEYGAGHMYSNYQPHSPYAQPSQQNMYSQCRSSTRT